MKFLIPFLIATAALAQTPPKPELVIYTYDSMVAKGGLGPAIFPLFEKKCGCTIKALSSGDGGQLVNRLQLDQERGKPTAHVVLGIDQQIWSRVKKYTDSWGPRAPKGYSGVVADAKIGEGFLPFDYGVFAFMADTEALKPRAMPRHLSDLQKPEWKKSVILEDPRTSTPGLAFLLYTQEIQKAGFADFWKSFRTQWLTLAPGWDGAYGLFLKKEAPLVWSYTTSQAYHREHGDAKGRYQAVVFDEGQPMQIEGAALVKGTLSDPATRKRAEDFLEFLLSPEVQALVPLKNWMLPVVTSTKLPESFRTLPQAKKLYKIERDEAAAKSAISEWSHAIEGGG